MTDHFIPVDAQDFGFEPLIHKPDKKDPTKRPVVRCPLKLHRDWRFAIDPNELIPQHNGWRELKPYNTRPVHGGDYTLEAPDGTHLDHYVCVERKSPKDVIGCAVQGKVRFEKALERLRQCIRPAIVIECSMKQLYNKGYYEHTKISPQVVVGSIIAWSARFRIPVFPCSSREEAIEIAKWWLIKSAHDWRDEQRQS